MIDRIHGLKSGKTLKVMRGHTRSERIMRMRDSYVKRPEAVRALRRARRKRRTSLS